MKTPSDYILTNHHNTTLYIGVASNLVQRVYQHKTKLIKGFSANYNLTKLVYFERFEDMEIAIIREKRLKHWHRQWKDKLISEVNPDWHDLNSKLL